MTDTTDLGDSALSDGDLRAAMHIRAQRELPDLAAAEARAEQIRGRSSRWRTWRVPLAAAAAVGVVAGSVLIAVRTGGSAVAAPTPGAIAAHRSELMGVWRIDRAQIDGNDVAIDPDQHATIEFEDPVFALDIEGCAVSAATSWTVSRFALSVEDLASNVVACGGRTPAPLPGSAQLSAALGAGGAAVGFTAADRTSLIVAAAGVTYTAHRTDLPVPSINAPTTSVSPHESAGATDQRGTPTTGATSPGPATAGRSGLTLLETIGIVSVIRDPSDPDRMWVTPNTFGPTGGGTLCSPLVQVGVTSQGPQQVEIVVGSYAAHAEAPTTCADVGQAPRPIAVDLSAPLGDRKVVDGTNSKIMTVIDPADYPEPTYRPDGYRPAATREVGPGITYDGERIVRTYLYGLARLEVAWNEGTFKLGDTAEVITTTVVDGVTATVWKYRGFDDVRLISWSLQPGRYITIQSNAAPNHTLSTGELVNIARSLPAG